jgi:MraZ protein
MRFFLSGAVECEFDKQGRINISTPLVKYADLTKECVIIGVNDRLEVWSKDRWEEFINENENSLSDIADNLFASNLNI